MIAAIFLVASTVIFLAGIVTTSIRHREVVTALQEALRSERDSVQSYSDLYNRAYDEVERLRRELAQARGTTAPPPARSESSLLSEIDNSFIRHMNQLAQASRESMNSGYQQMFFLPRNNRDEE